MATYGDECLIKSDGNSATTPRDLVNDEDVKLMLYVLSDSVAERMRDNGFLGRVVFISVRDCKLCSFTRQCALEHATCLTEKISNAAFALFQKHYSFRNSMLIYLQNPDATRVAGFNAWKTLGRSINKGEKGLQILAPSPYKIDATHDENGNLLPEPLKKEVQRMAFKVTYIFNISQTNGKELPELAHRLTGDVGEYDHLMAALQKISPYPISFEPRREPSEFVP